jgi:hypothetical protein
MDNSCTLDWLFGPSPGPSTIRLIDSDAEYRRHLAEFAAGSQFQRGDQTWRVFNAADIASYRRLIADCFTSEGSFCQQVGITVCDVEDYLLPEYEEQTDFMKYSVEVRVGGVLAGAILSFSRMSKPTSPVYLRADSPSVWAKFGFLGEALGQVNPFYYSVPDAQGRLPLSTVDLALPSI